MHFFCLSSLQEMTWLLLIILPLVAGVPTPPGEPTPGHHLDQGDSTTAPPTDLPWHALRPAEAMYPNSPIPIGSDLPQRTILSQPCFNLSAPVITALGSNYHNGICSHHSSDPDIFTMTDYAYMDLHSDKYSSRNPFTPGSVLVPPGSIRDYVFMIKQVNSTMFNTLLHSYSVQEPYSYSYICISSYGEDNYVGYMQDMFYAYGTLSKLIDLMSNFDDSHRLLGVRHKSKAPFVVRDSICGTVHFYAENGVFLP